MSRRLPEADRLTTQRVLARPGAQAAVIEDLRESYRQGTTTMAADLLGSVWLLAEWQHPRSGRFRQTAAPGCPPSRLYFLRWRSSWRRGCRLVVSPVLGT